MRPVGPRHTRRGRRYQAAFLRSRWGRVVSAPRGAGQRSRSHRVASYRGIRTASARWRRNWTFQLPQLRPTRMSAEMYGELSSFWSLEPLIGHDHSLCSIFSHAQPEAQFPCSGDWKDFRPDRSAGVRIEASSHQNAYFSESWKKRASGVLFWKNCGPVICPPLLLSEPFGEPRVG